MDDLWSEIARRTNLHGYMSGVYRQSDRVKATAEIFTPTVLVIEIMQKLMENDSDIFGPGKTVLDPACGDGQFLVPVKWLKILHHGMNESSSLLDIYGVDIMRDNVDLCLERLGGGNIIMGNTLTPKTRLPEQTQKEHNLMIELFGKKTPSLMNFID